MRMILNCALVLLALGAGTLGAGCGGSGGSSDDVVVSATTTQLADMARHVAGDRAEVDGILEANSDPHEYEPKPSDVEGVAEADLVLRSGGDLDEWLDQLIESSGTEAPSLDLIDHVEVAGDDPHWWQDPRNGIAAAEAIRDALIEVDPEGEAAYSRNAAAYVEELEQLDAAIAGCMEGVPPDQRKLVTSHDALGPYADRYGIEVIGAAIPALTTQAQASAGETAELVETIADRKKRKRRCHEAALS